MGARLSETELQKSLDFCVNLFNPTSPEQHEKVARQLSKELLDVTAPVVDPALLEAVLRVEKAVVVFGYTGRGSTSCVRAREWIARGINCLMNSAQCPIGRHRADSDSSSSSASSSSSSSESEKVQETQMVLQKVNARRVVHAEYAINNLESEPLDRFVVRLERGRLGLVKVL